MLVRWVLAISGLVLACAITAAGPSFSQTTDETDELNAEVNRLYQAGKFAEAIPIALRILSLYEKALGADHPSVGTSLNNLAFLYENQGRYVEAEPLYRRSLALREKALGPDHLDVGQSLNNLAELYRAQGRYAEAEPLCKRSLAIKEKALGPDHPDVGRSLNNLAILYENEGRYVEAEPLYKRSLAIKEKALGIDHHSVGASLNNLAFLYENQGRHTEAEPLYKRSLAIAERALGLDHPDVGQSLNNLAALYESQGRHTEAEPLYRRSLALREKALGPDHPDVGQSLNNLAELYRAQGRYGEAEPLDKRSLAIAERALGPDHPDVGRSLTNLAELYRAQGRYGEAEPLFKRSLAIKEKALGADHPSVGTSLNNLAFLYENQGRYVEAEPLYRRSLALREKALGPDHPDVGHSLNNLAWLAVNQHDFRAAANRWRLASALLQRRAERGLGDRSGGSSKGETQRNSWYFEGLVKTTHRLATEGGGSTKQVEAEMFAIAQWAQGSQAAASLAQTAARSAGGSPELAVLVRERQDLVAEWQAKDKLLIAAKSEPPQRRNAESEKELADRLFAIDVRFAAIDARLAKDFPNYAALASPKPISVTDVQTFLRNDEAVVLFLDTGDGFKPLPEETFVWAVTKTDVRWVRSDLGSNALQEHVAALRCGLDQNGEWKWSPDKWRWFARNPACEALRPEGIAYREPLPFNPAIAHNLYEGLFGGVEDLIKGKQLLIVPSGPLTSLPFQVLVTKTPVPGQDYRSLAWLARDHALTVLPSVSSLTALRRNAKPSSAPDPFIGFGNPVLAGRCDPVSIPKSCPGEDNEQTEVQAVATRSAASLGAAPEYFRDGLADVTALRKACPLPDTAHELRCVARSLGAPPSSLVLGKDMTETAVKKMPLDHFRIIHFATHGLLAGETERFTKTRAEPALLFTPPENATEEDDGLLTASEIAGLKLDADWVVMSACNTAGGEKSGAEALSGLAKAFFYAGARALLVSHWPVNTNAATLLTSRTFAELRRDKSIARAEAFRRATLALIDDKQRPWAAHPSVWAPFVVVGEGGVWQLKIDRRG